MAAAKSAAAGARRSTLHPRYASQINKPSAMRMPARPIRSNPFQQNVKIDRGAMPEIVPSAVEESLRRMAPVIAQQAEEIPFGNQLRGGVELRHDFVADVVDAHFGPFPALVIAGVGDPPQQGDHAQFLEQHCVERDLIETIKDLARCPGVPLRSMGLIGTMIVSCDAHSRTKGVMVGFPE